MAIATLADPDSIRAWRLSNQDMVQQDPSNGTLLVQFSLNTLFELYCQSNLIADRLKKRTEIFLALQHAATDAAATPIAKFLWGLALRDGFGCEAPDVATGNALILVAAKVHQNPEALNYIAARQFHINPEVAVKLFRISANQGNKYAWKSLAIAYIYGKGVEQNYATAVHCLKSAGEVGKELLQQLKTFLIQHVKTEQQSRAYSDALVPRQRFLFK